MEVNEFDRDMKAATFAEAGEHGTARRILSEGEEQKPVQEKYKKKKPIGGMILFGAVSLSLYIAMMTHQEWVMETFTKGGIYTVWPICTALAFSFIHGAFASNLLSVLGIEAKKH